MISIIIPVYNLENYIERTLDSVCAQTYDDLEIIVVDDGSKDKSLSVIEKYAEKDNRIKVLHQDNAGVTKARLNGIKHAKGDWIGFVDGDDLIESDMYKRLLNNAVKYNADISHCGYQMVFPNKTNYFYNTGCLENQDKITALKELLSGSRIEPGLCNKLFHKNLFHSLLQNELILDNIKINEDLLMNYLLFKESNNSVYEDFCPYHYMIRSGSASRSGLNEHMIYDPIKVKKAICELNVEGMEEATHSAYLSTCINVYNSITMDESKQFTDRKIEIRNLIIKNKSDIKLLNRKQRLLFKLIVYAPCFYKPVYTMYCKYFQKSKYI